MMLGEPVVSDDARRWREAAARAVQALRQARDDAQRLALLKRLARRSGDPDQPQGYPGFLKLLIVIAESDEREAQLAVADALALGLRRLDLPSGSLTSWGAGAVTTPALTHSASLAQLSGGYPRGAPQRQFGPLEYLTVWFCQRTQRPYLGEEGYRHALRALVAMCDAHDELRRLYPLKIRADASEGLNGAYTRVTRDRLLALADAWQRGDDAGAVAQAAATTADAPRHWVMRDL